MSLKQLADWQTLSPGKPSSSCSSCSSCSTSKEEPKAACTATKDTPPGSCATPCSADRHH